MCRFQWWTGKLFFHGAGRGGAWQKMYVRYKLRFLLRNTGVDSDFTQNFWGKIWRVGPLHQGLNLTFQVTCEGQLLLFLWCFSLVQGVNGKDNVLNTKSKTFVCSQLLRTVFQWLSFDENNNHNNSTFISVRLFWETDLLKVLFWA